MFTLDVVVDGVKALVKVGVGGCSVVSVTGDSGVGESERTRSTGRPTGLCTRKGALRLREEAVLLLVASLSLPLSRYVFSDWRAISSCPESVK